MRAICEPARSHALFPCSTETSATPFSVASAEIQLPGVVELKAALKSLKEYRASLTSTLFGGLRLRTTARQALHARCKEVDGVVDALCVLRAALEVWGRITFREVWSCITSDIGVKMFASPSACTVSSAAASITAPSGQQLLQAVHCWLRTSLRRWLKRLSRFTKCSPEAASCTGSAECTQHEAVHAPNTLRVFRRWRDECAAAGTTTRTMMVSRISAGSLCTQLTLRRVAHALETWRLRTATCLLRQSREW
eukprot:CAMPEP_0183339998 /NCGR_PEP_ID=MMETSP0164_2-20130417/6710_1 /TAXON_ID=221442 /ORGANISM="Coccolithus pelagicus ssp braarudi, Strain PLY182g" /LENGTH=251 /DNA_ID=CAMNT_0025510073 /DNA_START=61 /DNA_END=813 /DNA_ORIENTATION=-